jgi:hypothetical protein
LEFIRIIHKNQRSFADLRPSVELTLFCGKLRIALPRAAGQQRLLFRDRIGDNATSWEGKDGTVRRSGTADERKPGKPAGRDEGGRQVSIDGKTIRGSGKQRDHKAVHIVSAWVSENNLATGQLATEEKSNEITAIPELLDLIDVRGDTITIDAAD